MVEISARHGFGQAREMIEFTISKNFIILLLTDTQRNGLAFVTLLIFLAVPSLLTVTVVSLDAQSSFSMESL